MISNIFFAALPSPDDQTKLYDLVQSRRAQLRSSFDIDWHNAQDLHLTLGYIRDVDKNDIQKIIDNFKLIKEFDAKKCYFNGSDIFGKAIILKVDPNEVFNQMHQRLNEHLQTVSKGSYEFAQHSTFQAHITLGKFRGTKRALPDGYYHEVQSWCQYFLKNHDFTINRVAIMKRSPSDERLYQTIIEYPLQSN